MRYRFIFFLALSFILTAPAAMAQSVPNNEALPDVRDASRQQVVQAITGKLTGEQTPFEGNALLIGFPLPQGIGNALRGLSTSQGNTAVVNQRGSRNRARIEQIGQSNVAVMVQRGDDNVSSVLQDGSNNAYSSFLRGNNNETSVLQRGNNNTYVLGFIGNNLDHSFNQIGSNNAAVQVGVNYQPFGIQQIGNDMDITVRHNGAQ